MSDKERTELIKQAIENADAFGLGYISAVKELFEMYDIEFRPSDESTIFSLVMGV